MNTKALLLTLLTFTLTTSLTMAQELPFQEIPDYPKNYSAGNIIKRTIDGLGYRYYWATEDLTLEDLEYKPSEEARNMESTLRHIYGLSETIVNGIIGQPNIRPVDYSKMSYEELRRKTLENLKIASESIENKSSSEVSELNITFQNGKNQRSSSFWHMINGPISDAIYHVGQVVSFRRTSGNPMNPKVNVFRGKNRS